MKHPTPWRPLAAGMLACTLFTTPAHAFDPWEGAEDRSAHPAPSAPTAPAQMAAARPLQTFPAIRRGTAAPAFDEADASPAPSIQRVPPAYPAPSAAAPAPQSPVRSPASVPPAPVAIIVPPQPPMQLATLAPMPSPALPSAAPAPVTNPAPTVKTAAARTPTHFITPTNVIAPDGIIAPPPAFVFDTPATAAIPATVTPPIPAATSATPEPLLLASAAPTPIPPEALIVPAQAQPLAPATPAAAVATPTPTPTFVASAPAVSPMSPRAEAPTPTAAAIPAPAPVPVAAAPVPIVLASAVAPATITSAPTPATVTASATAPAAAPGHYIAPAPVFPSEAPAAAAIAAPAETTAIATTSTTAAISAAASPAEPMLMASAETTAPAGFIAPAPVTAPEAPALASVTVPEAPIVVAQAEPVAPLAPAPTYTPNQPTESRDRHSIGIEGFHDQYKEDSVGVDNNALYGSLSGDYTHYFAPDWFGGAGARLSYGNNDYQSPDGSAANARQWEFESRLTLGYDAAVGDDSHLKPYLGIGGRYFRDAGKNNLTSMGFSLYDRKILQFYAPVGVTYEFPWIGYTVAPTIEFGPVFYGRVDSHLGNIPGYYDIENRQHSGYELRADILMRSLGPDGTGWAFGPFFRYWQFGDSDTAVTPPTPSGTHWIEPQNTRLQLGVEAKYLF